MRTDQRIAAVVFELSGSPPIAVGLRVAMLSGRCCTQILPVTCSIQYVLQHIAGALSVDPELAVTQRRRRRRRKEQEKEEQERRRRRAGERNEKAIASDFWRVSSLLSDMSSLRIGYSEPHATPEESRRYGGCLTGSDQT